MPKIEQLNETLRKEIAAAVIEIVEIPNCLISILSVECDENFYSAVVYFSVLPDNVLGTALEKLRRSSGAIAEVLKKRTRIRKIPHLIWKFDPTEKNAESIEKTFEKIEKGIKDEEIEDINYQ